MVNIDKCSCARDAVKKHLKKHHSITIKEAMNYYGITDVAPYIASLRKEGMQIISKRIPCVTRFGKKGFYTRYVYAPPEVKND